MVRSGSWKFAALLLLSVGVLIATLSCGGGGGGGPIVPPIPGPGESQRVDLIVSVEQAVDFSGFLVRIAYPAARVTFLESSPVELASEYFVARQADIGGEVEVVAAGPSVQGPGGVLRLTFRVRAGSSASLADFRIVLCMLSRSGGAMEVSSCSLSLGEAPPSQGLVVACTAPPTVEAGQRITFSAFVTDDDVAVPNGTRIRFSATPPAAGTLNPQSASTSDGLVTTQFHAVTPDTSVVLTAQTEDGRASCSRTVRIAGLECPDADHDGFEDEDCGGEDCDDTNPAVNPDVRESCTNGLDDDCDGKIDGQDPECPPCIDQDGDGYEDAACGGTDCDDLDPRVHPGRAEVCDNGKDDDCDTLTDLADPGCAGCRDADGDGFQPVACGGRDCDDTLAAVNPSASELCDDHVDNDCDGDIDVADPECGRCPDRDGDTYRDRNCGGSDCDDLNAAVYPGARELCDDNGVDNDCDTLVDMADPDCAGCPDADGDGFHASVCNGSDCDDADPAVNPAAREICDNGRDDDCDARADAADPNCAACQDVDGDGFSAATPVCNGRDCDDQDPAVNPAAREQCDDTIDNDCDGRTDASDPDCAGCPDLDGDTFREASCGGSDCDDLDPAVHPGAAEVCDNRRDDDCDTLTDAADPSCAGCADADGDLYFLPGPGCNGTDCDDTDPARNPGAPERCDNGVDDDCDTLVDQADPGCTGCDQDGDGIASSDPRCGGRDCDDTDPGIPSANEIARCGDAKDNDCDTLVDLADPDCAGCDRDGDGVASIDPACRGRDCDDTDPAIPAASETGLCADGKDNDCDSLPDLADPDCAGCDQDGDGVASSLPRCGGTDCDDADPAVPVPSETGACDDSRDNDCDGARDMADPDCAGCEADGDGFVSAAPACGGRDCDDTRRDVNPGIQETGVLCADARDNDCDALTDLADPGCAGCDADGDGVAALPCGGRDCNDADPAIPTADESAFCFDGLDNDCDGRTDAADADCAIDCDQDDDGFLSTDPRCGGNDCDDANPAIPVASERGLCADGLDNDCDTRADLADADCAGCDQDGDRVVSDDPRCGGADCNDLDPLVPRPSEAGLCADGVDNDCDTLADYPADPDCAGCDQDGDTVVSSSAACGGRDCDDADPAIPAASEAGLCGDARDNDCDALTDLRDPDCAGCDQDRDGVAWDDPACGGRDCDDRDPAVGKLAETGYCGDAKDNDCDLLTDMADPDCAYCDADHDGIPSTIPGCNGRDCNDRDPAIPTANEIGLCTDGKDNDCDRFIDGEDTDCP